MVTVNAIGLPEDSPFRSSNPVLLLENPVEETQAKVEGEDNNDEEEGSESPVSREMSRQIYSNVVVLDDDQPRTSTPTSDKNTSQPIVNTELPPTNLSADQEAPTSIPPTIDTPGA